MMFQGRHIVTQILRSSLCRANTVMLIQRFQIQAGVEFEFTTLQGSTDEDALLPYNLDAILNPYSAKAIFTPSNILLSGKGPTQVIVAFDFIRGASKSWCVIFSLIVALVFFFPQIIVCLHYDLILLLPSHVNSCLWSYICMHHVIFPTLQICTLGYIQDYSTHILSFNCSLVITLN